MSAIGAGPGGELARGGTGPGLDDKDVGVVAAVGIGVLIADESDPCAVGRPLGVFLVDIFGGGQLLRLCTGPGRLAAGSGTARTRASLRALRRRCSKPRRRWRKPLNRRPSQGQQHEETGKPGEKGDGKFSDAGVTASGRPDPSLFTRRDAEIRRQDLGRIAG